MIVDPQATAQTISMFNMNASLLWVPFLKLFLPNLFLRYLESGTQMVMGGVYTYRYRYIYMLVSIIQLENPFPASDIRVLSPKEPHVNDCMLKMFCG